MNKLEKTIKGLEHCADRCKCNDDCPYSKYIKNPNEGMDECITRLAKDALELLKKMQKERKGKQ